MSKQIKMENIPRTRLSIKVLSTKCLGQSASQVNLRARWNSKLKDSRDVNPIKCFALSLSWNLKRSGACECLPSLVRWHFTTGFCFDQIHFVKCKASLESNYRKRCRAKTIPHTKNKSQHSMKINYSSRKLNSSQDLFNTKFHVNSVHKGHESKFDTENIKDKL